MSRPAVRPNQPEHILRTARSLKTYKRFFGPSFGKSSEAIVDIGAGDATAANEIIKRTDHKARVTRVDPDYRRVKPRGAGPAIAADGASMPFGDNHFDRAVALWVLPHLGPPKGSAVMREALRVLKPGGRLMIFPARPFRKSRYGFAVKKKFVRSRLTPPTLIITKPADFDAWPGPRKEAVCAELAQSVSYGGNIFKLLKWLMGGAIRIMGTNRVVRFKQKHPLL